MLTGAKVALGRLSVGGLLTVGALSLWALPAAADGEGECLRGTCEIIVTDPGAPSEPEAGDDTTPVGDTGGRGSDDGEDSGNSGEGSDDGDAEEGGPSVCQWSLQEPQDAPPAGKTAADGAWYECARELDLLRPDDGGGGGTVTTVEWLDAPPEELETMTPQQAAQVLMASFTLKGIDPGMVPRYDQGNEGTVGMPVWMWVNNTSDSAAWGPFAKSDTIGGLSMSATARADSVTWHMGDGNTVVCHGPGTEYQTSYGNTASPDCGYKYLSKGNYEVTAVTNWTVEWTGGGTSGTIPTTTSTTINVPIGQLQAVNIQP